MKRRIKAIWKLIRCKNYMLVTEAHNRNINFDFTWCTEFEAKRHGLFIHNFIESSDSAVREFNQIVNP